MNSNQVFVLTHMESHKVVGVSETREGVVKLMGKAMRKMNTHAMAFWIQSVELEKLR
jgi:hypothetical protein